MSMDSLHNRVDLLTDFVIPEAEHFVGLRQRSVPQHIALTISIFIVLTAIDFDEGANGRLPSEVMAQFAQSPQPSP